jgi:hypothetical protein
MADKRITSRTKVYLTRIGLKDWLVAVDSQKAALKAWDVHRNLFAEGAARVTNDPVHVELAMRAPGVPVAVPGRVSAPSGEPAPARKAAKASAASNVVKFPAKPQAEARALQPTRGPKPSPPPDRSKVDAAEQELRAFERTAARERSEIEKRKRALETELEAFDAETERRRIRLMKRIKRERDASDAKP